MNKLGIVFSCNTQIVNCLDVIPSLVKSTYSSYQKRRYEKKKKYISDGSNYVLSITISFTSLVHSLSLS